MEAYKQKETPEEDWNISDYSDEPFYFLLKRLPEELANLHLKKIITSDLDDDEAVSYVKEVLNNRKEAMTETLITDSQTLDFFDGNKEALLHEIETSVLSRPDNFLGAGMTAKIKQFDITKGNETLSMAVKYLLTPTPKTLSASAEHDMLREVERINAVEQLEMDANLSYMRVPHPFLHHKTDQIQCYGMQLIDGYDLEDVMDEIKYDRLSSDFINNVQSIDQDVLLNEIDTFFNKMHTYCIHADIKPKNIMVDQAGKFYIIDFGQSILSGDMTEQTRDQYETIKSDEIALTKETIRGFIRKIFELADTRT
jgi:tRNA A-37 threonylcarbamoyl transferase component Bud32